MIILKQLLYNIFKHFYQSLKSFFININFFFTFLLN